MKRKIVLGVMLTIMFALTMPLLTGCFGPRELPKYMVTWKNDDGTVICQKEYQLGEIPEYTEELPTSALEQNNVETTWKFVCWRGGYDVRVGEEYHPIDYDECFIAEYEPETTYFSFCFKNYDGEVLQNVDNIYFEQNFIEDVELSPKKPSQGNLVYYFNGWDINLDSFWHGEASNYVGSNQAKVITATYREVDTTVNTQGLQFALNDEETAYYVNGYNGNSKDIVITATYNNKPVEGICQSAIHNDNIESVYIAEGVKYIKSDAFYNSDRIKYVSIPDSIESIDTNSFGLCRGIEFTKENDCWYLGNADNPYLVFYRAYSDNETYDINSNTKIIAARIFRTFYDNLKTLVIPEGVRAIPHDMCAFVDTLESVTIPSTVKVIESQAFYNCSNLSTLIMNGAIERIEEYAFRGCSSLTELHFNEGLKEIDYAFEGCTGLVSISLPNSLERSKETFGSAQESAFTKQGNVYYLGNTENPYLFLAKIDSGTENITLSPKTKCLPQSYFWNNYNIRTLNFDGTLEEWFDYTQILFDEEHCLNNFGELYFKNEKLQGEIVIPNTVTKITKNMFKSQTDITNVVIPNTVTGIGDHAFYGCSSLTSVVLPNSVESMGIGSFANCTSLEHITLSNSLKYIGTYSFGKTALTEVSIPNSVEGIYDNAFRECSSLVNVIIPDSVEELGNAVFYECTNLKNILIPSSVTKIGYEFAAWTNSDLKIYYNGTNEQWTQIEIGNENDKLNNKIFVPSLSNLISAVENNNYSLETNSLTYDFDGGNILFNSNIYVKEGNQYVGYTLVAENNKVRFDNIETLDLSYVVMLRDDISNYVFNGDEFEIAFVDNCIAYVSNKIFEVGDVEISNRVIKYVDGNYVISLVAESDKYEATVKNLGGNNIYTPTNDEVSLFFLAMDYYNNFTQNNVVHMVNPYDSKDYGNEVDYKLDGNKVYLLQTSYSQSSTTTRYLSKEGDNYYYYQYYNGQWYKTNITEEQYNQNKSTGISADTRELLFNGSNYTKNGDVYNYTGDDVYFEIQNERYNFDDITLTIDGDVLTISFTVAGGVITGAYTFSNINTTTVEIPTIA